MVDRDLLPSKASLSVMKRYLVAVVWALRHLIRYTIYLSFVMVVFQTTEELKVACRDAIHGRVKIKKIELSWYNMKFESEKSVWQVY